MIDLRHWYACLILRADLKCLRQVDNFLFLLLCKLLQVNPDLVFLILLVTLNAPIIALSHHIRLVSLFFQSLIERQLHHIRLHGLPCFEWRVPTLRCDVLIGQTDCVDVGTSHLHHKRLAHHDFSSLLRCLRSWHDGTYCILAHVVWLLTQLWGRSIIIVLLLLWLLLRLCLQLALWVPHIPTFSKEGCISVIGTFLDRFDNFKGVLRY